MHLHWAIYTTTYVMSSVLKFTIVGMKLSFIIRPLNDFQSRSFSPNKAHVDSIANLTAGGGLGKARTSTKCCFLMPLTAKYTGHMV